MLKYFKISYAILKKKRDEKQAKYEYIITKYKFTQFFKIEINYFLIRTFLVIFYKKSEIRKIINGIINNFINFFLFIQGTLI